MLTGQKIYHLDNILEARKIRPEIEARWVEVEQTPDLFRYKLNVQKRRIIDGEYGYILELNAERGTKRRKPMVMDTLKPPVNEEDFNFTAIKPEEKLLGIKFKDYIVSVLINASPVTRYHCLLVLKLEEKLPQILTFEAIQFAIRLVRVLNTLDYKVGFNSPGAGASVNHQHLHLIYSPSEYFVQTAEITRLRSGIYRLSPKYAVRAICFVLHDSTFEEFETESAERIYKLVRYMIDKSIPHNLFITLAKCEHNKEMRIFIFPRNEIKLIKDVNELNISYCEYAGFFPLPNSQLYDTLDEKTILDAIKEQQSWAFDRLLAVVTNTKFFPHRQKRRQSSGQI